MKILPTLVVWFLLCVVENTPSVRIQLPDQALLGSLFSTDTPNTQDPPYAATNLPDSTLFLDLGQLGVPSAWSHLAVTWNIKDMSEAILLPCQCHNLALAQRKANPVPGTEDTNPKAFLMRTSKMSTSWNIDQFRQHILSHLKKTKGRHFNQAGPEGWAFDEDTSYTEAANMFAHSCNEAIQTVTFFTEALDLPFTTSMDGSMLVPRQQLHQETMKTFNNKLQSNMKSRPRSKRSLLPLATLLATQLAQGKVTNHLEEMFNSTIHDLSQASNELLKFSRPATKLLFPPYTPFGALLQHTLSRSKRAVPLLLAPLLPAAVKVATALPAFSVMKPFVIAAASAAFSGIGGFVTVETFKHFFSNDAISTQLGKAREDLDTQAAHLKNLNATVAQTIRTLQQEQRHSDARHLIQVCSSHQNMAHFVLDNSLSLLDITKTNKVTSALFGPQSLSQELAVHAAKARTRGYIMNMKSSYDLLNLPVSHTIVNNDALVVFVTHIPIYKEIVQLYQYMPLPISHPDYPVKISFQPANTFIAVNKQASKFLHIPNLAGCFTLHGLSFCPELTVIPTVTRDTCLTSLFLHNRNQALLSCPVQPSSNSSVIITRTSANVYQIYSPFSLNGSFTCRNNGKVITKSASVHQSTLIDLGAKCSFMTPLFSLFPKDLKFTTHVARRQYLSDNFVSRLFHKHLNPSSPSYTKLLSLLPQAPAQTTKSTQSNSGWLLTLVCIFGVIFALVFLALLANAFYTEFVRRRANFLLEDRMAQQINDNRLAIQHEMHNLRTVGLAVPNVDDDPDAPVRLIFS